jgi:DNA-binding transcriptional regulator WhiA
MTLGPDIGLCADGEPIFEHDRIARLRLRYPALSLRELGAKCDPPASKSAAHRRLRAVERVARR